MLLSPLFQEPMLFLAWIIAVLMTISVHEFSHALVARLLGDTTPERDGRITLNPRAHIDPLGLMMLVFVGFGWGRPVEFNPHNLRIPRWGSTIVALAGPLSNIVCLAVFGVASVIIMRLQLLPPENLLIQFLLLLMTLNLILAIFNLIPIPPLDGSKVLLDFLDAHHFAHARYVLESRGPMILLALILLDVFSPFPIFGGLFSGALATMHRVLFWLVG